MTLQKNYYFVLDLGSKVFNLTSDTLTMAFTDTAPTTATHVYADIVSPLSLTNLATSPNLTSVTFTQATGTATLGAATWVGTSQTGNFGPFRYVVFYDNTSTSDNIIGWIDYGSELTLNGANGDTLTITFGSGLLTIA